MKLPSAAEVRSIVRNTARKINQAKISPGNAPDMKQGVVKSITGINVTVTIDSGDVNNVSFLGIAPAVGDTVWIMYMPPGRWIGIGVQPAAIRRGGRWSRSAGLAANNGAITSVTFTTEISDTDNYLAPTSNSFTIPSDLGGTYSFASTCAVNGTLGAGGVLYFTNTDGRAWTTGAGTVISTIGISVADVLLAAGDTVSLSLYQNSGANRTINSATLELWRTGS